MEASNLKGFRVQAFAVRVRPSKKLRSGRFGAFQKQFLEEERVKKQHFEGRFFSLYGPTKFKHGISRLGPKPGEEPFGGSKP